MTFEQVVKSSTYSMLKSEAQNATHSYLFVSPDSLTTLLAAKLLVSILACKHVDRVDELKDVYFLPFGEKVLISDADFITSAAQIMPTELDKKYFIVRNFETANESAQNKLLKTLEEAPESAVIILLCANEYAVLPTVRSRCRRIQPGGYSDETLRAAIESEYPDIKNPSFAVAVAGGNLAKLISAVEGGTEAFDRAMDILTYMRKSTEILPYATQLIARKEKLSEVLDSLELILRDCMVATYRPELIKLKDNFLDIRELSKSYDAAAVIRILPVITRAKKRINAGGNVNSIVDELLFSILEEKAKCQK